MTLSLSGTIKSTTRTLCTRLPELKRHPVAHRCRCRYKKVTELNFHTFSPLPDHPNFFEEGATKCAVRMGAEQSKSSDDRFSSGGRSISFSSDLVNHLEDNLASPTPSADRQETLDAHIRARIQAELERLLAQEEQVRNQIEAALEKENLDKETSLSKRSEDEDGDLVVGVSSSTALQGDLEEIQNKVERFHARRSLDDYPDVKATQTAVMECYKLNPTTSLNCVDAAKQFKESVAQVEKKFVESLR